jgi:hypothetical protein
LLTGVAAAALVFQPVLSAQTLRAGAAHVDITPAPGPGESVRDRLFVSAIAFENGSERAALIGMDQGSLGEAVWQAAAKRIADELRIPANHLIMSATHTHSPGGPAGSVSGILANQAGGRGAGGRGGPSVNTRLVDMIVDAVRQANNRLEPARIGFGTGRLDLNVNRDAVHPDSHTWYQGPNPDAPSDKTIYVVRVDSLSGKPIAYYANYAMHPIDYYLSGITSADFAGQMARYIENRLGNGVIGIFSQSASGDQNPIYLQPMMDLMGAREGYRNVTMENLAGLFDGAPQGISKPEKAERDPARLDAAITGLDKWITAEGALMGEEVLRVGQNIKRTEAAPSIWGGQKEFSCPGRIRTDKGREGMEATYQDGPDVKLRVGLLRLGPIAFASVDGEVYNEIWLRLKKEAPFSNLMMVTLADGGANSGYIPDDASFSHRTFQVLGSRLKPGCAENGIVNNALDLMSQSLR